MQSNHFKPNRINKILPYNPKLKRIAKQLRKNMTLSEVLLWNQLKQNKMMGFDFDRQRPIDDFIVDFYCKELMLAIEIDGSSHYHEFSIKNDERRQKKMESMGVTFLRFDDLAVKKDMANVLRTIENFIQKNKDVSSKRCGNGKFQSNFPDGDGA